MPSTETAKLYGRWLGMWNGDLSLADDIVAPDCVVHDPGVPANTSDAADGIERIKATVKQARAPFERLIVSLDVGPIEDGGKVATRWTARGSYAGGLPGTQAAPGTMVEFSGVDLLRLADGKVAEYWLSTDALQMMQQLGAAPAAASSDLGTP